MWNKNISAEDCLTVSKEVIIDCTNCYSLAERPLWQLYGHAVVMGMLILVSLVGNSLFFILFTKHRKLRHRSTIISIGIIFVNTTLIITFHIPVLITTLSGEWIFSFAGCQVFGFLTNDFFLTYWLTMGSIAFDRFCMVHFSCYPKRSKCVLICLIVASWVVPVFISTVTVDEYSVVVFRQNLPTCIPYYPNNSKGRWLIFIIGIFTALTGGAIPFFLYIIIVLKAAKFWHSRKATVRNRNDGTEESIEPQASDGIQICDTFALIFLVSCVTQIPSALFLMVRWISINAWCDIPHELHFIVAEILSSTTAITPFLIMKEKNFRRKVKLLMLCCCKQKRNNGVCKRNRKNITSARPGGAVNLISFLPSEGHHHSNGSNPYRARSCSFPVTTRHKIYASTISRNHGNLDRDEGKRNSLDPGSSPSSYGVEEVRNMAVHML